jgi:hypothetical protein
MRMLLIFFAGVIFALGVLTASVEYVIMQHITLVPFECLTGTIVLLSFERVAFQQEVDKILFPKK